jgi:ribosome biogenesis protein BMS1
MVLDLQDATRTFADGIDSSQIRLFGTSSAPLEAPAGRQRRRAEPRNGGPMLGVATDEEYDDEDGDDMDDGDDGFSDDGQGIAIGDEEDEQEGDVDFADSGSENDLDLATGRLACRVVPPRALPNG